jgi:dTDP-4-amino-4,6-dideoxygalactose transaminase
MMTTDREDLYQKLYEEWAFGGWAPTFMTLNFRMTEAIAAIGLAQLQRVDDYVAEYTRSLDILDNAIRDCTWLRNRHVPDEAVQCGYIWVCTWEGDKHGLSRDRFKQALKELGSSVEVGWVTEAPAYTFDIFSKSTAYHEPDCPVRCPYYKSDYRYHKGLCPEAEELMPRLLSRGLVEAPLDEVKAEADRLRQAIQITERG